MTYLHKEIARYGIVTMKREYNLNWKTLTSYIK